jgi:hypothetical protein
MEEGDTTPDSSDDESDDATVTIWGEPQAARRTAGADDAPSVDIWGSAQVEAAATDEPDPVDPPPDLWGDGGTPRERRQRRQGDPGPIRPLLPATWVATPKRKSGWISRLRRAVKRRPPTVDG